MEPELVSDEDPPCLGPRRVDYLAWSCRFLIARTYCYDESHELSLKPPFPRDWQMARQHGSILATGPRVAVQAAGWLQ